MSKKKIRIIIIVLCLVILAIMCIYFVLTRNSSTYDKYTGTAINHTNNNKLIGKEDIKSLQNEINEYGITEYDSYTISYSADVTLVTVIYPLTDNTVYVSLRFNDDLTEVIDYDISDDNCEGDAEDVDE